MQSPSPDESGARRSQPGCAGRLVGQSRRREATAGRLRQRHGGAGRLSATWRLAIRRDTPPPVVRVAVLQSVSCGLLAGAVFGGLTLWHDVGGLMSLIWSAEDRWLALALFVFAVGSGFVTLAVATAVSFGLGADD